MSIEIFEDRVWQMSLGERAAVEGVLSQLKPALAIEIGSMEGACLRHVAAHAGEAHSFDLQAPSLPMPGNVQLHTGDSHELLPAFLRQLADEGRNVDFAMVDGDHSPEGVRRDLEDLLNSDAVGRAVILIHDTANERVRQGLDAVAFSSWPKVRHVELDWVPGRMFAEPELRDELWYGLGLVLVDTAQPDDPERPVYERRYHAAGPLLARARDQALELAHARRREDALRAEVDGLRERVRRDSHTLQAVISSPSWWLTRPLRAAKRLFRR